MKAGKLRDLVSLERDHNHGVPDATGGQQAEDWRSYATRNGKLTPLSGRERFEAQQVKPETSHKWEMRFEPTLTIRESDSLLINGTRRMQISWIHDVEERHREWWIFCKETKA